MMWQALIGEAGGMWREMQDCDEMSVGLRERDRVGEASKKENQIKRNIVS